MAKAAHWTNKLHSKSLLISVKKIRSLGPRCLPTAESYGHETAVVPFSLVTKTSKIVTSLTVNSAAQYLELVDLGETIYFVWKS